MLKEYEIIISCKKIDKIEKGTAGVILLVYEDKERYEVEFVDDNNETIEVVTVHKTDITRKTVNENGNKRLS